MPRLNKRKTNARRQVVERVYRVRIANLQALAAWYGSQGQLARALGIAPAQLSQMIGANPSRPVTERAARDFEQKLGLDLGALDLMKGQSV